MEWLAHSEVSQTMRYTHVAPEVSKDTGQRLGDHALRSLKSGLLPADVSFTAREATHMPLTRPMY